MILGPILIGIVVAVEWVATAAVILYFTLKQ
jgi:hypothetical protein